MVSKIAVMAIVAIIAAPILIGYGMNFETETGTRYVKDGNAVNVTGLLTNDTLYTYTNANINELNLDNLAITGWGNVEYQWLPDYVSRTTTKSSFAYVGGTLGSSDNLNNLDFLIVQNYSPGSSSTFSVTVRSQINADSAILTETYDHVVGLYWNKNDARLLVTYYTSGQNPYEVTRAIEASIINLSYTNYSGIRAYWSTTAAVDTNPGYTFVQFNKGWRFPNTYNTPPFIRYSTPSKANDMLVTFNLDSAGPTEDTFRFIEYGTGQSNDSYHSIILEKDTSSGSTEWYAYYQQRPGERVKVPYNPDISNNSYQIYFTRDGAELRYVGAWHDTIGESNYFWSNKFSWGQYWIFPDDEYIIGFRIDGNAEAPPYFHTDMIFRIDAANVIANTYQSIHDVTYDPQGMTNKANPATQIKDVVKTGTSITFGGNTYTVTDGKITIDGHSVPIRDMTFSSTVNDQGTYDNAISGTVVSQTAAPSQLVFGGSWVMGVSTYAQDTESYTITHWVPGKFAWQGVDSNFIMVGLMASVSAFIGLAMYGRRSGAKVLPLLLVCGGAAFVFLLMI